jgi:hypothetical protein
VFGFIRNAVRLPFGNSVRLRRNPHSGKPLLPARKGAGFTLCSATFGEQSRVLSRKCRRSVRRRNVWPNELGKNRAFQDWGVLWTLVNPPTRSRHRRLCALRFSFHLRWYGISFAPSTATISPPPSRSLQCNSAASLGEDESAARIFSTDSGALAGGGPIAFVETHNSRLDS